MTDSLQQLISTSGAPTVNPSHLNTNSASTNSIGAGNSTSAAYTAGNNSNLTQSLINSKTTISQSTIAADNNNGTIVANLKTAPVLVAPTQKGPSDAPNNNSATQQQQSKENSNFLSSTEQPETSKTEATVKSEQPQTVNKIESPQKTAPNNKTELNAQIANAPNNQAEVESNFQSKNALTDPEVNDPENPESSSSNTSINKDKTITKAFISAANAMARSKSTNVEEQGFLDQLIESTKNTNSKEGSSQETAEEICSSLKDFSINISLLSTLISVLTSNLSSETIKETASSINNSSSRNSIEIAKQSTKNLLDTAKQINRTEQQPIPSFETKSTELQTTATISFSGKTTNKLVLASGLAAPLLQAKSESSSAIIKKQLSLSMEIAEHSQMFTSFSEKLISPKRHNKTPLTLPVK